MNGQGPETTFARAADGTYLAYQTSGEGPLDIVFLIGGGIPVEDQMEGRECASFIRRLSAIGRVIRLDRHGIGMSDPLTGSDTLEQWTADALTVMDAVRSERAAFFGNDQAASMVAMMCAATHPERVTRLVLYNGVARFLWAEDYPWGWSEELLAARIRDHVDARVTGEEVVASATATEEFRRWFLRARRRGLSPARSRELFEAVWRSDVRGVLDSITAPTLVIYRNDPRLSIDEHARYLASRIPDARLVALPGREGGVFTGDTDAALDAVREFLTGTRTVAVDRLDRALATVLFTDIVNSTAQAADLGDRAWRERLDDHDAMVRSELDRFRGREIKATGDGFLATFDGPARAIRCACAIRDGARALGIDIRAGLHTGEVELRDTDIGGISVHTAARVQALAGTGEVLVSRTVVDLVAGSGITFEDRGEHQLKGIPGSWTLCAVRAES